MPPKAKLQAPIDRPLSRAYVREFTGWATAEPPGTSDPTSLRVMENVQINRDGSARIRPGLRYLSYEQAPYSNFEPPPAPIGTPTFVAYSNTFLGNGGGSISTLALPVGTQLGDVLVLALLGAATIECLDPRMELVLSTAHWSYGKIYIGYADTLDPLSIFLEGTWAEAGCTTLSGEAGGEPLRYRLDQLVTIPVSSSTTEIIPALPDSTDLSGAVCVFLGGDGIGGSYGDQDWTKSAPFTLVSHVSANGYNTAATALTTTHPVPAFTTPHKETGSSGWAAAVIGLTFGDPPTDPGPGGYSAGIAFDGEFVGTHEAFYLNDGTKAYLLAVREADETVGFRVLVHDVNDATMYSLEDPLIDFEVTQPYEVLNFSAGTTYVKYLQIDNKIFALSDNGEPMRLFTVGSDKTAKALASITRPDWDTPGDKLTVVHPDAAWINAGEPAGTRRNRILNPSFEKNTEHWVPWARTQISRPAASPVPAVAGSRTMKVESRPERTNLVASPLHDVAGTGIWGWTAAQNSPGVSAVGDFLNIQLGVEKKTYFAQTRQLPGIEGGAKYQFAFDVEDGAHVTVKGRLRFFGVNGAQVGEDVDKEFSAGAGRKLTNPITAPKGAVSARLLLGGENTQTFTTFVKVKNVVLCLEDEPTSMFHGGTAGSYYFWTEGANNSASVYHPPVTVGVTCERVPVPASQAMVGSLYVRAGSTVRDATLDLRLFNKDGEQVAVSSTAATPDAVGADTRLSIGRATQPATTTRANLQLTIATVARGEAHYVDAAMLESGTDVVDTYFDGHTADIPTAHQSWLGTEHASASLQQMYTVVAVIPPAETRTPDTLISSVPGTNDYSFGFFYTFSNEVGESAASKTTVVRAQRAWSNWVWETPNAAGEPSGTDTNNPERCADQLAAFMSQEVFDVARSQGATAWTLYMFTWSNQDAAPVTALKVGTKALPVDATYDAQGWITVTPVMSGTDVTALPTKANRYNYSKPSAGGQGLVAADRMVMVNDPTAAAVIKWSSNRIGEYTDFTASKGGGYKTLTSGNLFVPACVKLWQNPQSADTITILCLGTDGHSTAYYMQPAQVASQTEATNIMGFEETTATPGTTSPYGVEVFNNSLYHPVEDQLMKSTASNYNINHKSQTDLIRDMWEKLATKYWIVSSQHDGRLYYIVNNPHGEQLQPGCKGNEIWVLDGVSKSGTWSRYLIQAHSLRKIEFGGQIYMSVIRPDGVYYLDPEYARDDTVAPLDRLVSAQAIPWKLETNTQGANRAHDAWCHLQQMSVQLGYFQGRMRFGLRSVDINGKTVDMSKIVRDDSPVTALSWDIEEMLSVRRDLKEWFFYAESITDDTGAVVPSAGQVSLVQFRYTPVSVNVGYEYGAIETFEYGRDVALAVDSNTVNGTPLPLQDSRRP